MADDKLEKIENSYSLTLTVEIETMIKHYVVLVDLLKFYLDLVLKFNIFSYAITGATVSFYLSQPNQGIMRWALVLPAIVNLGLAVLAFYSTFYVSRLNRELNRIKVVVNFKDVPDGTLLTGILYWSCFLFTIIGLGLIYVTFVRPITQ